MRHRFPPHAALRAAEQAGKNSFPQTPFLFARLLNDTDFFGGRRGLNLGGGWGYDFEADTLLSLLPSIKTISSLPVSPRSFKIPIARLYSSSVK